jgi:hypothetical protein
MAFNRGKEKQLSILRPIFKIRRFYYVKWLYVLSDFSQNWNWLINFMKTSVRHISNTYIRLSSTINTSAGRQAGTDMHSCPWHLWKFCPLYMLINLSAQVIFVIIALIPWCRKCACSGFIFPSLFWSSNSSFSCCSIIGQIFFYSCIIHSLHISWPPDSKGYNSIFH